MAINIDASPLTESYPTLFDGVVALVVIIVTGAILEWFIRAEKKPWFPVGVATLCGAWPLAVAQKGYGLYLMYGVIVAFPASIVLCSLLLPAKRERGNGFIYFATLGKRMLSDAAVEDRKRRIAGILCCGLFFFCCWFIGIQCRRAYCRKICRAAEPVLAAFQKYRAQTHYYPDHLSDIPNIQSLVAQTGLIIREGRRSKGGELDVGDVDDADMTVWLQPDGKYLYLVPIEKQLIISMTRFGVFTRSSEDSKWTEDYIIWTLGF